MAGYDRGIDFKECFRLVMRVCAIPVRVFVWLANLSSKEREKIVLAVCCGFICLILAAWVLLMIF